MEFEKSKLVELKAKFDSIINTEEKENVEFWYARDLQENQDIHNGEIFQR